jgi:predicted permease
MRRARFAGVPDSPAFAVGSLAIGIGAITAAFTVVDAFMLRGLPVREPHRLVAFSTAGTSDWRGWTYAMYTRWRDSPDALFEAAASSDVTSIDVPSRGEKKVGVRVSLVSANYFEVIGASVPQGRSLNATGAAGGGSAAVAVISDAFWDRWFGRTPDVLTRTIELHGITCDIVGVARKGFTGHVVGHPSDVWVPLALHSALTPETPGLLEDRWGTGPGWLKIVGRLRDDVTAREAETSASLVHQRFIAEKAAALGENNVQVIRERKQRVSLLPATTGYAPERPGFARPLTILFGITALVLLVACANFTNLMLTRAESRRREFVIRLAVGAGRWRLIRQSSTECIVLALAGGLLGVLFAHWAAALALKQLAVMLTPVEFGLEFDTRVYAFAGGCVATAIGFGLWPGTRPARSALLSSVYESAGAPQRARTRGIAGRAMLIAQFAMCTVLLIGAGLLLRTVINLRYQELGFDRNVLVVPLSPREAGYSEEAAAALVERLGERLSAVPGITAVGVSGPALMDYTNYWVDGTEQLATDRGLVVAGARWTSAAVGPGFFDAVGISLVEGRGFDTHDGDDSAGAVVINQSLARFLFGQEPAIGRRIRMSPRGPMQPVIGVAADATQISPRDRRLGVIYHPLRGFGRVLLAVRTAGRPSDAVPIVEHQLVSIASDLPAGRARTIDEVLDHAIAQERLMSGLSLFLAALAIAIGCAGLYALMSYDVARRTHELGIRLALGATRTNVIAMVLREGAWLLVPALAIGIPLGVAASRQFASQLYGVQSGDAWTLASVVLVLAIVALVGTFRPARNASRIDPIALLRSE